jgi:ArsR family transcriptional regulator, arsenate/arsenite/antimonite-responsive transcriptional repressor
METTTATCPACQTDAPPLAEGERTEMLARLKALADPTRLEVYRLIASQPEPMCVCTIVDRFAVSQPTISHHLRVLREAGLVAVSRRGAWAYYQAIPGGLEPLRGLLDLAAPFTPVRVAGD